MMEMAAGSFIIVVLHISNFRCIEWMRPLSNDRVMKLANEVAENDVLLFIVACRLSLIAR